MTNIPKQRNTFICSRGTLDGAYPALMLGINSVRLGHEATVFFTFMGIDVVRKGGVDNLKFYPAGAMGAIPGMAGMATGMMKKRIEDAGVPELSDMLEIAQLEGVKLVACRMTMEMMKLSTEDLIEDIEVMTAEEYLKIASDCTINMFT